MTLKDLAPLQKLVQVDAAKRGLAAHPQRDMFKASGDEPLKAAKNIADTTRAHVGIVTGFYVPTASPPAAETDGPLGALMLARVLVALKLAVTIGVDPHTRSAIAIGLDRLGLTDKVAIELIPDASEISAKMAAIDLFDRGPKKMTHLISVERVGPSRKLRDDPAPDACFNMAGVDITEHTRPAWRLFDTKPADGRKLTTIGIGDGGNEIGMGAIPTSFIEQNIANGGRIACRTRTDFLFVCGVSNWGGYALAASIAALKKKAGAVRDFFDAAAELALLEAMVKDGPLVDGTTGLPTATVDGLPWARHAAVLDAIAKFLDDAR